MPGRNDLDLKGLGSVKMYVTLRERDHDAGFVEERGDVVAYIAQYDAVIPVRLQKEPEIDRKGE